MTVFVYIGKAVGENMDFESGLTEGLTGVSYAEFCGDSADVDVCCVKHFQDLAKCLFSAVLTFKTRVLLLRFIASFVKDEFFAGIWGETFVDLRSMGAGNAV